MAERPQWLKFTTVPSFDIYSSAALVLKSLKWHLIVMSSVSFSESPWDSPSLSSFCTGQQALLERFLATAPDDPPASTKAQRAHAKLSQSSYNSCTHASRIKGIVPPNTKTLIKLTHILELLPLWGLSWTFHFPPLTVIHKKKIIRKINYLKWTLILNQISNLKSKYETLWWQAKTSSLCKLNARLRHATHVQEHTQINK